MESKKCIYCGEEIHPMRLEILPKTKTCVKCSQEPKKAGRLVSTGEGEDVETNLEILDQETYIKLSLLEKGYTPQNQDDSSFNEE